MHVLCIYRNLEESMLRKRVIDFFFYRKHVENNEVIFDETRRQNKVDDGEREMRTNCFDNEAGNSSRCQREILLSIPSVFLLLVPGVAALLLYFRSRELANKCKLLGIDVPNNFRGGGHESLPRLPRSPLHPASRRLKVDRIVETCLNLHFIPDVETAERRSKNSSRPESFPPITRRVRD